MPFAVVRNTRRRKAGRTALPSVPNVEIVLNGARETKVPAAIGGHNYLVMARETKVPAAIAFYNDIGGAAVASRNRMLVLRAGAMLAAAWGSRLGTPEDCVASTCMVGLPRELGSTAEEGRSLRLQLAVCCSIAIAIAIAVSPAGDRLLIVLFVGCDSTATLSLLLVIARSSSTFASCPYSESTSRPQHQLRQPRDPININIVS